MKRNKEESVERRISNEIAQEVVAGIEKKARAQVDIKPTAQRAVGRSVKQSWDCSQIEKRRRGRRGRLAKGKPVELQWTDEEKLEKMLERRRMVSKLFAGGIHAKGT